MHNFVDQCLVESHNLLVQCEMENAYLWRIYLSDLDLPWVVLLVKLLIGKLNALIFHMLYGIC
jgi:hypothetical protein